MFLVILGSLVNCAMDHCTSENRHKNKIFTRSHCTLITIISLFLNGKKDLIRAVPFDYVGYHCYYDIMKYDDRCSKHHLKTSVEVKRNMTFSTALYLTLCC